jgi:hypothetical protein
VDKPVTPLGYAIFCDDIRQEVGNKFSFMGIYSGVAVFETDFPITVPRLCIAVNFLLGPKDERRDVKVKVIASNVDGENVVVEGDLPAKAFEDVVSLPGVESTHLHSVVHIAISPLTIEKPGSIKVRAYYGDDEYKLGSLQVLRGPLPVGSKDA